MKAKVIPFRPHMGETPPGKRPVYLWEIDSNFRPQNGGRAWDVIGFRDDCAEPSKKLENGV